MILESACPEIESDGWHSAPGFGAYMFGTLSLILEMLRDKQSSVFFFNYYYYYYYYRNILFYINIYILYYIYLLNILYIYIYYYYFFVFYPGRTRNRIRSPRRAASSPWGKVGKGSRQNRSVTSGEGLALRAGFGGLLPELEECS